MSENVEWPEQDEPVDPRDPEAPPPTVETERVVTLRGQNAEYCLSILHRFRGAATRDPSGLAALFNLGQDEVGILGTWVDEVVDPSVSASDLGASI